MCFIVHTLSCFMCSNILSSLKVLLACIIDWNGLASFLMATCELASTSNAELYTKNSEKMARIA